MRILLAGISIALLATPSVATAAPAAPAAMAPKDIQTTFFTGQAFTATANNNIKFKMVFSADGRMSREPIGKAGVKDQGSWKLSKDGYCSTWRGSKQNCYRVMTSGDNKWSIMKGTNAVATWSK